MEEGQERVLTVTNYILEDSEGEAEAKTISKRITIAPHMVHFTIASDEPFEVVNGRELYRVNVIMTEGTNLELNISMLDLNSIERAIGTFFLP